MKRRKRFPRLVRFVRCASLQEKLPTTWRGFTITRDKSWRRLITRRGVSLVLGTREVGVTNVGFFDVISPGAIAFDDTSGKTPTRVLPRPLGPLRRGGQNWLRMSRLSGSRPGCRRSISADNLDKTIFGCRDISLVVGNVWARLISQLFGRLWPRPTIRLAKTLYSFLLQPWRHCPVSVDCR